ncbi:MAG: S9 family peptidase [Cyanothece sp. SIO1E1]|nr:S9 family peptidase [Cyanothece sp. SIO1E1]
MVKHACWMGIAVLALISCTEQEGSNAHNIVRANTIIVQYPETYQDSTEVSFFENSRVVDPFRWLEYEYSPSVTYWTKSQQSLTRKYFDSLPDKWLIEQRLRDLWNYERRSLLEKKGAYYYQFMNRGLQEQSVFYRSQAIEGPFEQLFDPNQLSEDGSVSVSAHTFSADGRLLGLQLAKSGSDWKTIRVLDLRTGRLLPDVIEEVKHSAIAWDKEGFYYSRYPSAQHYDRSAKNEFHQLFYHRLGTDQSEDEVIFADRIFPERNARAITSVDQRFLILQLFENSHGNAIYFRNLTNGNPEFIPIYSFFDEQFDFVGGYGNKLLFRTTHQADKGRLIQVSTSNPGAPYWEEILPEGRRLLDQVYLYGNKLIAHYLEAGKSQLIVYSLSGDQLYEVDLKPLGLGAVSKITGNPENNEAFLGYSSYNFPERIYRLNLNNGVLEPYFIPELDFDPADYEIKQVAFDSYDGVSVDMSIVHRKGLRLTGNNPGLLLVLDEELSPPKLQFNPTGLQLMPIMLEHNGVCAIAQIRGHEGNGLRWLRAGAGKNKQNSFDDFQAAAEYLIANKYTSSEKLAIYGQGRGGLVVGACLTQRPDLYRVTIPANGLMDMLRYQRFAGGWLWKDLYGESTDEELFSFLYAYSPLHNVVEANYPATLVMTAEHDDRIVPAHSYKFTAALQALQKKTEAYPPILIQVENGAGPVQKSSLSKAITSGTQVLSFILFNSDEAIAY